MIQMENHGKKKKKKNLQNTKIKCSHKSNKEATMVVQ